MGGKIKLWRETVAVDLSKFAPHVQAAIKAINLAANALDRAEAGRVWLDKNAPPDWRLQMISIHKGQIHSQVRMCRNDENPLALAFRRVAEFKGSDGRVTWGTLMNRGFTSMSQYAAEKNGFIEQNHNAPENVVIDKDIDSLFLDDAWAIVLGELQAYAQPVNAYPNPLWPQHVRLVA